MQHPTPSEVTKLIAALGADEADRADATPRVFELLYAELRSLARVYLHGERPHHTLQPTALVHEAFARLVDQNRTQWRSRAHVLGIAGQAMRRVLIDHARRRSAEKRGGDPKRVTLSAVPGMDSRELEMIELDDALTRLAHESERAARVAELKLFAGLSGDEIAEVLGVSRRTVTGDWTLARMWLARELAA